MALWRRRQRGARDLKRRFVTPEGVDLYLELGTAGARAAAFLLDMVLMTATLVAITLVIGYLALAAGSQVMTIVWLIGAFVLRNGWFILFEMGSRGATPGKRAAGLRVVARDGARLTGGAVVARNAMREIEVFLPLSFLGGQVSEGLASTSLTVLSLVWSGIFLFFPLLNRDRLRVGDLVAGTWVVKTVKARLAPDLAAEKTNARAQPRRRFSEGALALYGVYELQTLEEVLRQNRDEAIAVVAATIRRKAGIADDGDDRGFLQDYYAALCERLERGLLVGRRRENKFEGVG